MIARAQPTCLGSAQRVHGFSLVEMLVAIVVLGIGLLGIAKMSLSTVQSNGSALMRTTANAMIQQIVDDMRANQPQATLNLGYNIAMGSNPGAALSCATITAPCTAAQIATADLALWYQQLGAMLPSGQGSVSVVQTTNPATGSAEYTAIVTVQWNDAVAQNTFANSNGTPTQTSQITMETLL